MKPIEFEQANKNLLKPEGWTDEECRSLPVYSNEKELFSLWKMSWKERLSALFFGRVWLVVYSGVTQPPVELMAMRQLFKTVKQENNDG